MRVLRICEVRMRNGDSYCGEITHKDSEKIVLRLRQKSPEQKIRISNTGIAAVHDMGWHKVYALR